MARVRNSLSGFSLPGLNGALDPRKTPVQSRSVETVRVILEAAARILEDRGFAGYTTNAIAHKAGIGIGSLYQYFPSKDAVTTALVERETALLIAEVDLSKSMADGRASLLYLIHAATRHQLRRPRLAVLLDLEEQRLGLAGPGDRLSSSAMQAIAHQLRHTRGLSLEDIDEAAADIVSIIKGMVNAAGERGETNPGGLEMRVARAVIGYLGLPLED